MIASAALKNGSQNHKGLHHMLSNKTVKAYLNKTPAPQKPLHTLVESLPETAQKIIKHYAAHPNVRLIMIIGSIASANHDKHSDIDIVLVCNSDGIPTKEQRLATIVDISAHNAIINSADTHIWNFGTADDFTVNGQEICTQFFTKQQLQDKIDLTVGGFYAQVGMEHPLAALASLLGAAICIDKDNLYPTLRRMIDPYPKKLGQIIIDQEQGMYLPYYLDRLTIAIERHDLPFANKMVQGAIDSTVYIIFALYGRFPKGPKRLEQQINSFVEKDVALPFLDTLLQVTQMPTNIDTLPQKQLLLKELSATLHNLAKSSNKYKL
jgi:predicted nucleotidyltransferase